MKIYKRRMYCEPLRDSLRNKFLIRNFHIERESGFSNPSKVGGIVGLEAYLKYAAWKDDESHNIRAYVIKSYFTGEIIAYFTLKCGIITLDSEQRDVKSEKYAKGQGIKLVPKTIPSLEIAHFAIDDNYKKKHGKDGIPLKGLGAVLYPDFIFPVIKKAADLIGIKCVYLYAAGGESLIEYYKKVFGFSVIDKEDFVPVMPYYDKGCSFMYYIL